MKKGENYMEKLAFDIWLSNRMDFSIEDKRACLETAKMLLVVMCRARAVSVLGAMDEIPPEHIFFHKAGDLAGDFCTVPVEKRELDKLEKILNTYIAANNCKGKKLLESLLIKEWALMVAGSYNPYLMNSAFEAYFGYDFSKEYNDYINVKELLEKHNGGNDW